VIARIRGRLGRERRARIIRSDLRRLRREHGAVFRQLTGDGGVALIVSLSDFAYQVKTEGMLAQGFGLEGLTPVAVVPGWPDASRGYFDFFGVTRKTTLAGYADPGDDEVAARETAAILKDLDAASLMDVRYRETEIGRHVLSTASRILHEGALDVSEPRVRDLIERVTADVVRSTLAAERLLDELSPEIVLCNERNYAAEAPISDVALARGINVVQFVSAFQDDALVFKRYTQETKRIHPRSLSDESWREVRVMPWGPEHEAAVDEELAARFTGRWGLARRNQEWTTERDPDVVLRALGLDPSKRTAVVFSHVLWDANMFWGEDLFADQERWLVETVRAACANDRVNWIVKLHPANVWKLRREGRAGEERNELSRLLEQIGGLPPHVAVLPASSDVATKTIFSLLSWGITIRGSVGIELPCFGVPVLTAGTGFYAGRGFTIDSESAGEYLARLAAIDGVPALGPDEVELARRHAYALFRLRPLRFTSFSSVVGPLGEMGHPLDYDLRVELASHEELERAEDLRTFGAWAVRSRELDYLGPLVAAGYDRPS
jgi:hypothetical protein